MARAGKDSADAVGVLGGLSTAGISGREAGEDVKDRIQRQGRLIAELQAELEQLRQASVDTMLGQLRLHEAVLLYVGDDVSNFAQQITQRFGSDVERAVSTQLFVLDNAPVPPEVRETIRKAINHGMFRW